MSRKRRRRVEYWIWGAGHEFGSEVRWAERATSGVCGDVAQAARAVRHLRLGRRGRLVSRLETRVGINDQEVKDGGDDEEGDDHVEEVAIQELALIDGEVETREVRLAEQGGDDRRDQVLHKGGHDSAKGDADYDADRHVDEVASGPECPETARHAALCFHTSRY